MAQDRKAYMKAYYESHKAELKAKRKPQPRTEAAKRAEKRYREKQRVLREKMTDLRKAAERVLDDCGEVVVGWQSLAPAKIRNAAVEALDELRAALAEPPAEGGGNLPPPHAEVLRLRDLLGKANALARIRLERIKALEAQLARTGG